uniref:Fatty acid desaturase domain-containing protein n=1 Tax=Coccolithus braarudii TaxID=221442 RepID=A0A7S0PX52_9EUKA|mmetsp:Transcript_18224/g.39138  ORF Transcript_18224/g.39138 Transcript_18224/m.39138 type:complete len:342 (+) Transcript_18224:1-1026(+)
MTRLRTSWRERGLFKPRPVSSAIYGLAVVAAIVMSVMCAPHAPVLAGIAVGTCWAQCGFLQHMGGHREWGRKWSFFFQHFFEGLCKGGSSSWWRNRHNKHHAKTNVIGEDGDLRTTPFFAWDPMLAKKVPDWSLKTQAFTFLPALGAYVFMFAFTVRKYAVVKQLWHEVALMIGHYAVFAFGLKLAGATLSSGLAFYCTGYAWQGIYLGFFFGLSHFAVERVPSTATWLESSMIGTIDWGGSSAFCGYLSGFLNIQIEHHMAPQMPMENLRQIRGDCRAAAEKFGLPYREVSFIAAAKLMMVGLYRTGRDELKLRSDRRKYTRAQAVMGAASAVVENLKAD